MLGFLPNDTSPVEVTESFNASNVVTISDEHFVRLDPAYVVESP